MRPPAGRTGDRSSATAETRRRGSVVLAVGRTMIAVFSILLLLVTGYAWLNYRDLAEGLHTSELIAEAGPDGAVDILLTGMDSRTDASGNPLPEEVLNRLRAGDNEANLTDTIILVHIPEDGSRAMAYSFPRDAYVTIPGDHGNHKINSAFGRGKTAAAEELRAQGVTDPAEVERRSASAGRALLLRTVEAVSGVSIDHYAEVNLLGFYEITKAVGGVPVCLNEPVEEPLSGASFRAGHQKISGSDALAFVRQRHGLPQGDLDRVVRQQAFLAGLVRSMLNTGTLTSPSKLGEVIESVQDSLVLDKGWDVMSFVQRLQGLAGGAIRFETVPIEDSAYQTPDGLAVKVDPAEIQREIYSVRNGRPIPALDRQRQEATGTPETGNTGYTESPAETGYAEEPGTTENPGATENPDTTGSPTATATPGTIEQQEGTGHPEQADLSTTSTATGTAVPQSEHGTPGSTTPSYATSEPMTTTQASQSSATTGGQEMTSERTTGETTESPTSVAPRPEITADGIPCVN